MLKQISPFFREHQKGQIVVILAIVFIGLVAIVGLAIDLGFMYVSYARLRRGIDGAALSATAQFKKGMSSSQTELGLAARQFLALNGIPNPSEANIDTCASTKAELVDPSDPSSAKKYPPNPSAPAGIDKTGGDPALCKDPPRKLVRVIAGENVPTFFLSIVGIRSVPIRIETVAEAASIDVVLVIDASESMGIFKEDGTQLPFPSANRDPKDCNLGNPTGSKIPAGSGTWTGECYPFHNVKVAAWNFVNSFLFEPYDQVAIVYFDTTAHYYDYDAGTDVRLLSGNVSEISAAIRSLKIYEGVQVTQPDGSLGTKCPYYQNEGTAPPAWDAEGPCRLFDTATSSLYWALSCPNTLSPGRNPGKCQTTNIASGLRGAASVLSNYARQESLWVSILLTDGVPNSAYTDQSPPVPICPNNTWGFVSSKCRDMNANVRHCYDSGLLPTTINKNCMKEPGSVLDPTNYDAYDAAMDQADILGLEVNSLVFAIGLGCNNTDPTKTPYSASCNNEITRTIAYAEPGTPAPGLTLLNYVAKKGLTGSYYQATADELNKIFLAIANKIATRLTR